MRIKSYFSASVETAIAEARRELGSDAMLITSRRSAPEYSHLGDYEVVFGITPENEPSAAPRSGNNDLHREVAALRSQLEDIRKHLGPTLPIPANRTEPSGLYERFVASDLAPEYAREFADFVAAGSDLAAIPKNPEL